MQDKSVNEVYDVALSFAGEDRAIVEQFATGLRQRGISVFYDRFVQPELWGKNLYEYLSDLYSSRCKYCVVFVSRAYAEKDWTRLERRSVQARDLHERNEFILPVRLDDSELPGLLSTIAYVDLRAQSLGEVVDILCTKLGCDTGLRLLPGKGGRLVLELQSDFNYDFFRRQELVDLEIRLFEFVGPCDARLVGCELSPHRVQIQTTAAGYSRLREKLLSGELDTATGVRWTGIAALEGKERAPAPTQTPLARLDNAVQSTPNGPATPRQVVCHLPAIAGLGQEAVEAEQHLGKETTTDTRAVRAFITAHEDLIYVHSTFQKKGCHYPTKIATNLPVDLFTFFVNLTFLELPNSDQLAELKLAHTKYAKYFVNSKMIGRRGDEFYAGAMNIQFV